MVAACVNQYLAAPTTAPRSLRERVLEYAVQKRLPYPFFSPPYEREPATKHTWAVDMLEWLRYQTGDAVATGNFLSEACRKDWMDRASLHMAEWADKDMEAIYKVTKSVMYYQAVHRAAGAVYLRARNIQPEIQPYLKQVACLPFHEIPLQHWEALAKRDTNPQIADILNYPEGVMSMLANGFVAPLQPSWFQQGYPPASAEGREVCPTPPAVCEGPGGTDQVLVTVPSSWLKPQGGSTCTPLQESLQFLKPPAWDLEKWVLLTADQKTHVIVGADASEPAQLDIGTCVRVTGEELWPTRVTPVKRPRYEAARVPPSLGLHATGRSGPLAADCGLPPRSPALNYRWPVPATPRGALVGAPPPRGEPHVGSRAVSPDPQPHGDCHIGSLALANVPTPRPYRPAGFGSPERDLWRYAPRADGSPVPVDAERSSPIGDRSPVPVDAERYTPVRDGSPDPEGPLQYDPFRDCGPVPRVLQLTPGSPGLSPGTEGPMEPMQHGSEAPTPVSVPSPGPAGYPPRQPELLEPNQVSSPASFGSSGPAVKPLGVSHTVGGEAAEPAGSPHRGAALGSGPSSTARGRYPGRGAAFRGTAVTGSKADFRSEDRLGDQGALAPFRAATAAGSFDGDFPSAPLPEAQRGDQGALAPFRAAAAAGSFDGDLRSALLPEARRGDQRALPASRAAAATGFFAGDLQFAPLPKARCGDQGAPEAVQANAVFIHFVTKPCESSLPQFYFEARRGDQYLPSASLAAWARALPAGLTSPRKTAQLTPIVGDHIVAQRC
eukprot:jgi/Botrbrau1/22475/Bobra.114_2s0005.1